MQEHKLTAEEQYRLNYARGFRRGSINSAREILIRCIKMKGKEQNTKPSKLLIQKIKRETDKVILNEFIRNVVIGNITVSEMEISFDMFFCIYDESGTVFYIERM